MTKKIDKVEFIAILDGTLEEKIYEAFKAGYKAGVSDGQADNHDDHENEYRWWKERQEVKK